MKLLTNDRAFYKQFFSLFALLAAQNIIVLSMSLADNLMLGAYSQEALSGAAAANQIQFLINQITMAVGDTLVVLSSQYWGQRRREPIHRAGATAFLTAGLIGLFFFSAVSLFPRRLLSLFTENEQYIEAGAEYLSIVRFSYLLFALTSTALALLRSVEVVKIAGIVSIFALLTNCGINYLLIFGKLGAPELGIRGAAIGTLAARILECAVILSYLFLKDKRLAFRPRDLFRFDGTIARDYLRLSRSFLLVGMMFGVSTCMQTVILGHLEDAAVAASSAASTIYQFLKVAAIGASSATAIVIGGAVGRGDEKKVREYAYTLQILFLILGLLTSVTLFFIRIPLLTLYTGLSPEALKLANQFILVLCITCIGTSYEMPVLCGIVRGGGDGAFVLKNDFISIWCIVLPLSALAAFVWGAPPALVLLCLNADQLFKCGAAVIKCNRFRWIRHLTRKDGSPV